MIPDSAERDPTAKPDPRPQSDCPLRHRATTAAAVVSWLYVAGLLLIWLLIWIAADRWWVATAVMFSPRWVWSLPLGLLLPVALLVRRRTVWLPAALAVILLLGPVMRLCVPWRRSLSVFGATSASPSFRIVTLNADESDLDSAAMRKWIDQVRPDIVLLQACRGRDRRAIFGQTDDANGWHGRKDDELVIESRFPLTGARVYTDAPFRGGQGGSLAAYDVETPAGKVRLFEVHLATPRYALLAVAEHGSAAAANLRANAELRRAQAEVVRRLVDDSLQNHVQVIVAGDFNTPPDSTLYRRYWSDFSNAFSAAGFGFGNTHFTRRTAIRIDHILAGPQWRFRKAWVGPPVGSAHHPVVADVEPTGLAAP